MNVPTLIQVLTVVGSDATVLYQQVYVNNEDAANQDFDEQIKRHQETIKEGGNINLRRF